MGEWGDTQCWRATLQYQLTRFGSRPPRWALRRHIMSKGYTPVLTRPIPLWAVRGHTMSKGYTTVVTRPIPLWAVRRHTMSKGYTPVLTRPIPLWAVRGHTMSEGYTPVLTRPIPLWAVRRHIMSKGYAPVLTRPIPLWAMRRHIMSKGYTPVLTRLVSHPPMSCEETHYATYGPVPVLAILKVPPFCQYLPLLSHTDLSTMANIWWVVSFSLTEQGQYTL